MSGSYVAMAGDCLCLVFPDDQAKLVVGGAWIHTFSPKLGNPKLGNGGEIKYLTAKQVKMALPEGDVDEVVLEVGSQRYLLIGNKFFKQRNRYAA